MKIAVKTLDNKTEGDITLDETVFGVEVKSDVLHRMVKYQLNKRQQGTHKTKMRSEVQGTGKKPWAQKGTGRARAGDLKRPQDRGGGVAFGPVTRSHATELPKKLRMVALRMALSAKAKDGKLIILKNGLAKTHKTKDTVKSFVDLGIEKALIIHGVPGPDENFKRATGNIPHIDLLPSAAANVYDILHKDQLVLTEHGMNDLVERLSTKAGATKKPAAKKTEEKKAA